MQRSDEYNIQTLQRLLHKYVCSVCWGHLTEITQEGERYVVCGRDRTHTGFVTQSFADRERQQSKEDIYEVKERLTDLGVIEPKKTGLSLSQIIKSLGF